MVRSFWGKTMLSRKSPENVLSMINILRCLLLLFLVPHTLKIGLFWIRLKKSLQLVVRAQNLPTKTFPRGTHRNLPTICRNKATNCTFQCDLTASKNHQTLSWGFWPDQTIRQEETPENVENQLILMVVTASVESQNQHYFENKFLSSKSKLLQCFEVGRFFQPNFTTIENT